jgi:hypothetical protein
MTYDEAMKRARDGHTVARRSWRGAMTIMANKRGGLYEVSNDHDALYYPGSFDQQATDWYVVRSFDAIMADIIIVAAVVALAWGLLH